MEVDTNKRAAQYDSQYRGPSCKGCHPSFRLFLAVSIQGKCNEVYLRTIMGPVTSCPLILEKFDATNHFGFVEHVKKRRPSSAKFAECRYNFMSIKSMKKSDKINMRAHLRTINSVADCRLILLVIFFTSSHLNLMD
jgi:hypothetical protein